MKSLIKTNRSSKDYRDRFYDSYVTNHLTHIKNITLDDLKRQRIYETYGAYYKRFLPADKNAKILDVGCGYGRFLYFLEQAGYKNVQGIDISKEQLEVARRLGITNVLHHNASDFLQEHEGEFDMIIALDFLEHFSKDKILSLLNTVYRGLKEGGVFLLRAPNADGLFGSRFRYWDFTHEVAFTKTSVSQVLACSGFKDIEVCPVDPVILGVRGLVRYCLWKYLIVPLQQSYIRIETGTRDSQIFSQNLIAIGRKKEI